MLLKTTALEDSNKSFLVGRGTFTASIDMNYDETDAQQASLDTRLKSKLCIFTRR